MRRFEEDYESWSNELALLARRLGHHLAEDEGGTPVEGRGSLPLQQASAALEAYGETQRALLERMRRLVSVYPLATLYDSGETESERPAITLNNTSLGTY